MWSERVRQSVEVSESIDRKVRHGGTLVKKKSRVYAQSCTL